MFHNTKIVPDKPHRSVAGIIPVHMQDPIEDFGYPWDDVLMPLAPNYTAIQHAVKNCMEMGCDTIWIVVNDKSQPIIRKMLKDMVARDEMLGSKFIQEKLVPIYYVPMSPRDTSRRDSHGWAALHGCWSVAKISNKISKWFRPKKFYVSWPFGVHEIPSTVRHTVKLSNNNVLFTHCSDSIRTGEYLGMTISYDEVVRLRRRVWHNTTLNVDWFENPIAVKDRYSARYITVKQIFDDLQTEGYKEIEVPEYYRIDSWEGYRDCLRNAFFLESYEKKMTHKKQFRGIGSDSFE